MPTMVFLFMGWLLLLASSAPAGSPPHVVQVIDVSPVWPGQPTGFQLITRKDRQFVAFYDAERRMVVGARDLDSATWQFKILPVSLGWDGHNYIRMTFDDEGQLHLSGDMHNVPLIYFRTTKPGDIASLEQIKSMVGKNENSCTYPMFLRGASNELIFTYRDGSSGRGSQIYDVYDQSSHQWRRLLDQPLTDGRGKMSAYLQGPVRGPDGYFHLVWVWRDSPDCSTNHDLSYARSKDLVHWETSAGKPVELPMTIDNADVIDPVPVHGGMVNGNTQIGFDADKRVIVSYHKYDAARNTQIYNARYEGDHWKIYQTTDWNYRWDFGGNGSIGFDVHVGPAQLQPDGSLAESFSNPKDGGGLWKLDAATLKPIEKISRPQRPAELDKVESTFPGMQVRWAGDEGTSGQKDVKYWLRWETLGPNRDQPRSPPLPEASMLRVYEISGGE